MAVTGSVLLIGAMARREKTAAKGVLVYRQGSVSVTSRGCVGVMCYTACSVTALLLRWEVGRPMILEDEEAG